MPENAAQYRSNWTSINKQNCMVLTVMQKAVLNQN